MIRRRPSMTQGESTFWVVVALTLFCFMIAVAVMQ